MTNKNKFQEPVSCSPYLQSPVNSNCRQADALTSTSPTTNSSLSPVSNSSSVASSASTSPANGSAGANANFQRRLPNVFSPRERLEAFESSDFDRLKPLLMFNLESIQTYRADCKYKKARR